MILQLNVPGYRAT